MDPRPPTVPVDGPLLGHARVGDTIYTVSNGDPTFLLSIPTPQDAPPPKVYGSPSTNFRVPRYVSPAAPYMMFVPAIYPWYGLLQRLDCPRRRLPIVQIPGTLEYGLVEEELNRVWTLELNLVRVLKAIRKVSSLPVPQGIATSTFSSRSGYRQQYRTEAAARHHVFESFNGFLPLIGHLAMYFWYMSMRGRIRDIGGPDIEDYKYIGDWREAVAVEAGVHLGWIALLEQSAAGDLTIPRVGGIVDFSVRDTPHAAPARVSTILDFMVSAIIFTGIPLPLYISWGALDGYPDFFVPHGLRRLEFVPDTDEVHYLRGLPGKVAFSPWISRKTGDTTRISSCRHTHPYIASVMAAPPPPISSVPPPSSAASLAFPPVERYSQQRPGETMQEFFSRRQKANREQAQLESPKERQSREQRAAHASKGNAPGRQGARVYTWQKIDGYYIRKAGGHQNVTDIWRESGPEQRRYDSYYDEWDICSQFGDDAEDDSDEEDDSGGDWTPLHENSDDYDFSDDLPVSQANSEMYSSELDLDRFHNLAQITSDDQSDFEARLIAPAFKDMIYLRFGCMAPKDTVQTTLALPTTIVAKKILGDPDIIIKNQNQADNFCLFLAHCNEARSLSEIPINLLDFHQPDAEIYSDWTVNVRREILNDKMFYVVSEKHHKEQHGLHILIQSATTALEIVRQGWGPTLKEVIEELLPRGIQFMVCCRSSLISPPKSVVRGAYSGLGYRPQKYEPDKRDYLTYVSSRNLFLRTPRGRAALLMGGIIGRLARSEVSADQACRGPSDDVFIDGMCLWDQHSTAAYWDDFLTNQEIDLICGVYNVATGQNDYTTESGEQMKNISWWPRPSAFATSGLNVGWWTPLCEAWFQRRLRYLETGNAILSTQAQWKHNLKLERQCLTYQNGVEKCAANILSVLRP